MPRAPRHDPATVQDDDAAFLPAGFEDADDAELAGEVDGGQEAFPRGASPAAEPPVLDAVVPREAHGRRLDQWLVSLAPEFSRSHLQQLIEQGCVALDGQAVRTASRKVASGQRASVVLRPTAQSQAFAAEPMALPIVFEDEHLLVVDKPAGLVVHPAAGNWHGTLMNGLLAHHAGASGLPRAGIVHRLDKDTSGLMVVGKTLAACTALTRAIAAREVHRQYQALAWGRPPAELRIEAPVGRDPVSRVRMAVVPSGKPAMTDVRLVASREDVVPQETLARTASRASGPTQAPGRGGVVAARGGTVSAVECTLHTGRTHQIRVHLASRGCPLVADPLYGGRAALGLTRQALHAARLSFAHPATGEALSFEASLPHDMDVAWQEVVHNQLDSV